MSDKKDYQLDLQRRPRRLRQTSALRALVEETDLKPAHLIQPLFVLEVIRGPSDHDERRKILRAHLEFPQNLGIRLHVHLADVHAPPILRRDRLQQRRLLGLL